MTQLTAQQKDLAILRHEQAHSIGDYLLTLQKAYDARVKADLADEEKRQAWRKMQDNLRSPDVRVELIMFAQEWDKIHNRSTTTYYQDPEISADVEEHSLKVALSWGFRSDRKRLTFECPHECAFGAKARAKFLKGVAKSLIAKMQAELDKMEKDYSTDD